jgi:hypothetical protein
MGAKGAIGIIGDINLLATGALDHQLRISSIRAITATSKASDIIACAS